MEIEKVMTVTAPAAQVWSMLLDPNVMGSCVPGMKSIEVISDVEYVALIHVKISFISAKFKLKTTIVEQKAPHYLRCEGTGEDASVASSLKQQSEIFLAELPDGQTELRMKVKVDVLGRLGTFGLSVMKTKADRMWEEFGQNLVARLNAGVAAAPQVAAVTPAAMPAQAAPAAVVEAVAFLHATPAARPLPAVPPAVQTAHQQAGWLARLLGRPVPAAPDATHIRIEVRRADTTVTVHWPLQGAGECAVWLRECLK
ncbi:MAG: CoxG family protein [Burkholderiaceae bacterium]